MSPPGDEGRGPRKRSVVGLREGQVEEAEPLREWVERDKEFREEGIAEARGLLLFWPLLASLPGEMIGVSFSTATGWNSTSTL